MPWSLIKMRITAKQQYIATMKNTVLLSPSYKWSEVASRLESVLYFPNPTKLSLLPMSWRRPGLENWRETTVERSSRHRDTMRQDQGICGDSKYIYISQRGFVWRAQAGKDKNDLFKTEMPERELRLEDLAYIWKDWPGSYDHIGAVTLWNDTVWLPIEAAGKALPALLVKATKALQPYRKPMQLFFRNPFTDQWEAQTQCGWCAFNPMDGFVYTSIEAHRLSGIDGEVNSGLSRNIILVYDVTTDIGEAARTELSSFEKYNGDGQREKPFSYLDNSDITIPKFVGIFPLQGFDEFVARTGYQELVVPYFDDVMLKRVNVDRAEPFAICGGVFSEHGQLWLSTSNWNFSDSLDILDMKEWVWREKGFWGHLCLVGAFDGRIIDWRIVGTKWSLRALGRDDYGYYEPEGIMLVNRGDEMHGQWPEVVYVFLYQSVTIECNFLCLGFKKRKFSERRVIVLGPNDYSEWK